MKIKRIVALLLLAVLTMSLFSGCNALDNAKNHQAVYYDKSGKEIKLKGEIYKVLPESEDFNPVVDDYDYCYLTKKDVPVLLSPFNSTAELLPTCNGEVLFNEVTHTAYARSDVYEKYEKLFKEYTLDTYAYFYSTYYYKTNKNITQRKAIDKDDVLIIEKAISEGEKVEIPEEATYGDQFDIEISDKSMLFSKEYCYIFVNKDSVYILIHDKGVAYKINNAYLKDFSNMVLKYRAVHEEE